MQSPPIRIELKASWPAPPQIVEILETAAAENSSNYFPFLDDILSQFGNSAHQNHAAIYKGTLHLIESHGYLSSPGAMSSYNFALSMHSQAPKIEAYYQYYNETVVPSLSASGSFDETCNVWADWNGHQICSIDQLKSAIEQTVDTGKDPVLLPFDHVFFEQTGNAFTRPRTLIVYGDLLHSDFKVYHDAVMELARSKGLRYVLRYKPSHVATGPLYLSGYGVELALKRTDYIVIDDRNVDTDSSDAEKAQEADASRAKPNDPLSHYSPDIQPLKLGEIVDLSVQAAQYIAQSANPLETLVKVSQDFPKHSALISKVRLNESFSDEINTIQSRHIAPGGNAIWLNGLPLEDEQMSPLALLRMLRRERQFIDSLKSMGLSTLQAVDLISSPSIGEAQTSTGAVEGLFDTRDANEGGNVVVWMNDLEKDSRYKTWASALSVLMRGLYPGQLHSIARNLYNVIIVTDLSSRRGLELVSGEVSMFIRRGIPIRFGIVAAGQSPNAQTMAKTFHYLVDNYGRAGALTFLSDVTSQFAGRSTLDLVEVEAAFHKIVDRQAPKKRDEPLTFNELAASDSPYHEHVQATDLYTRRLSVTDGGVFINGRYKPLDESYQRSMIETIQEQMRILQKGVYDSTLTDEMNIYEWFMDLPTTYSRRNAYVFVDEPTSLQIVNLVDLYKEAHISDEDILTVESVTLSSDTDTLEPLIWHVIGDLDSDSGSKLVKEAITYLTSTSNAQVKFVHMPSAKTSLASNSAFSTVLYSFHESKLDSTAMRDGILQIFNEFEPEVGNLDKDFEIQQGSTEDVDPSSRLNALKAAGWNVADQNLASRYWSKIAQHFAGKVPPANGLVQMLVNGRIIGPIAKGDDFTAEDFALLADYERLHRVTPVRAALTELNALPADNALFDVLPQIASVVSSAYVSDTPAGIFDSKPVMRFKSYEAMPANYTAFTIGDEANAYAVIGVAIDPTSEKAQKWSSLLQVLSQLDGVYIQVHLNPSAALSELPLKRFYRYVLKPSIEYDNTGVEVASSASFTQIPTDPLLTLELDVPQAWLVAPKESVHDLDNIRLGSLGQRHRQSGVEATFELEHILVEGHARDALTTGPPRGLQLILGSERSASITDTIVMANLGYLQLKANPGIFKLALREGKSTDIYDMQSVGSEGWNSRSIKEIGSDVLLTSFEGAMIYPRVTKRPGKEKEEILDETAEVVAESSNTFMDKIKSFSPFGSKAVGKSASANAEINIFSVASGHLYERFIYIMILSVLKHTDSSVKFWFIENFLSPSFKDFIPHMAEQYGFQYELVTYKWPSWLRAQSEKQRKIWGYKILFLDVLFPLNLDKVIFVDADQIVRTDLKELIDMDLQGAPYGYTPMCNSREEMEGFRFWNQGYWKEFLQGKPYHISALYVVDLHRFRQIAAGDRLRGQYQALSADPNSLSNLDQDLPNNMQHNVKIFSLPQDWLWCETWCSDEALKTAKTIDLCNNPLTKEPKLARARRQVPEWEEYDNEISAFANRLSESTRVQPLSEEGKVDLAIVPPAEVNIVEESHVEAPTSPTDLHVKDEL